MSAYLDHNATTPLDERVLEAMLPHFRDGFGNASSTHAFGRSALTALDTAREQLAELVGAHPSQVVFTNGGTEANNAALKGAAFRRVPGGMAISAVEHASVREPVEALARHGWRHERLPVDSEGRVETEAVSRSSAAIVSVMWANNETGVLQDISALAEAARDRGALLHTDAVQAAGKVPIDFTAAGAHLMSVSAHKLYGPKGIGALIVDKAVDIEPLVHGGGQERGRRGGTENVAAIAGFGKAAELARSELQSRSSLLEQLRERFEAGLSERMPEAMVFGAGAKRLPNTSFFALPGIEGGTLALALDRQGLALSSGSACGSRHDEPSPVLGAMAVPSDLASCAVRASFGIGNTEADVDALVGALAAEAALLRKMAGSAWA
ncbi:cysteine desulfurase family protein [Thiohalomonas denitrificans]|uniref:cysteine desulfurase family protein n=1 Tax=Thiohalomonas denitrificans TaxID=415747 RepID=UPI0026F1A2FB|nr:cysteine desulfurase family protein [Thiohalomonas denitrificans]